MADKKKDTQTEQAGTTSTSSSTGQVSVKKTNTIPRRITKADFQKVGVEDQDLVEFNRENNFTAPVSEAAAKHLVDRDDFKLA